MVTRYELEKEMPKMREKYHKMERKEKGAFLDSMERVTAMSRKHLTTLLSLRGLPRSPRRPRAPSYSEGSVRVLHALWERSGRLSAERLKSQLPLLLPWAVSHGLDGCTREGADELLRMSARQMSRRLAPYKRQLHRSAGGGRATTRSRTMHVLVPVSVSRPQECAPGLLEIDTVAHGGGSGADLTRTVCEFLEGVGGEGVVV